MKECRIRCQDRARFKSEMPGTFNQFVNQRTVLLTTYRRDNASSGLKKKVRVPFSFPHAGLICPCKVYFRRRRHAPPSMSSRHCSKLRPPDRSRKRDTIDDQAEGERSEQ